MLMTTNKFCAIIVLAADKLSPRRVQAAGKGAQQAIAQCIAVVSCSAGQTQIVATVNQLLKTLQVSTSTSSTHTRRRPPVQGRAHASRW